MFGELISFRVVGGNLFMGLLSVVFVAVLSTIPADAATLYVPSEYLTLFDAIDAASDNDIIELAPGVYFESHILIDSSSPDNLTIKGATGNWDDVLLNGGGQNWLIRFDQGRSGRLESLTFANAFKGQSESSGAAVMVYSVGYSASLEIENCRFVNCEVSDADGGALYCSDSVNLFVRNCLFESNQATGTNATAVGGAVSIESATYEIRNCQFLNNISDSKGGALFLGGGSSGLITACLFQGNILTFSQGKGGAVWVGPAIAEVRDSTFVQNYSGLGPSIAVDHGTFDGFNCDLENAGYISGGAVVTMTCCNLGDLESWNIQPIVENDGCTVAVENESWDNIKAMFR